MRSRALLTISLALLGRLDSGAQELLTNGGFDRHLFGWEAETAFQPRFEPGSVEASSEWSASDAGQRQGSGSARFTLVGARGTQERAALYQCVPVEAGRSYVFSARIRIERQIDSTLTLSTRFFADDRCEGTRLATVSAQALPPLCGDFQSTSGEWRDVRRLVTAPEGARRARVALEVAAGAAPTFCAFASVQGLADDVSLQEIEPPSATWVVPASAHLPGAFGSFWTTNLWLANGSGSPGAALLTFSGHGVDGRGRPERLVTVPARGLVRLQDAVGALFGAAADWGAIFATLSPNVSLVAENSTPSCGSGTVGETVPAIGPRDFIGQTPRLIFPVRQNAAFRTNLALANPTEEPLKAHLKLIGADGTVLAEGEVTIPPLGMVQQSEVAAFLGVHELDGGWLEMTSATEDARYAAYATLIDNGTNDPRTLLPIAQILGR